jgi:serine protease Do
MSKEGHILTNAHVLDDASRFFVDLHDRRRYPARLVGFDETSDLALLKIDAPSLIPADWGNSADAEVGSIVWAVGSPYGFQQTVTSGILSGKDRPGDARQFKQSLLQTDAAVNPGNSGGPLVDSQGRVIGINTSIFGETFQGISFAVPSETALFVYNELREDGKVTRGFLGAVPSEVSYEDWQRFRLPDLFGAKLTRVEPSSPAFRAGIRTNDIIRSWNGVPIKDFRTLYRLAEMTPPYTTVSLTLLRDGRETQTEVTVGEYPN